MVAAALTAAAIVPLALALFVCRERAGPVGPTTTEPDV